MVSYSFHYQIAYLGQSGNVGVYPAIRLMFLAAAEEKSQLSFVPNSTKITVHKRPSLANRIRPDLFLLGHSKRVTRLATSGRLGGRSINFSQ